VFFARAYIVKLIKCSAKVVIADRDTAHGLRTVAEIVKEGHEAIFSYCDVVSWEDQVATFELAISTFGAVDVVVPNAGIGEVGSFIAPALDNKRRPVKPQLTTIDVNLTGALYTCHLALHYLKLHQTEGSLKALVLLGSMASWQAIPRAPLYTASKHAILGVMRSLDIGGNSEGIRLACIHPFFADTGIVPLAAKVFLSGIPFTPVERIAGAIFHAATDMDMNTSGCAWLLPDDGPVFRVEKEKFKLGVYQMIDDRHNSLLKGVHGVSHCLATGRDLCRIFGKQFLILVLTIVGARLAWRYRELWS
jgi:NAD(P)-dependent dehydrogenase (short-subunit alcohol dehydrogenase family)